MKKALLLSEIFPPLNGGSGRWFWEVYTRLPKEQVVVAAGDIEAAQAFDATSPLNCYRLPLRSLSWGIKSISGLAFYWRVFWQVLKIVKLERIEIIHCGRCLPEGFIGFLISKLKEIPYICFIHGEDVETAASSRELSWIVNKVLKGADKLIANSQNTANLLLNNWYTDPSKTVVVNPGTDATLFIPAPLDRQIKKSLGWGERPVILTVGRLQERKGHDMLIRALPDIVENCPDVLYAIIGNGEQKTFLKTLVNDLQLQNHVLFMAEVSDQQMIQCYQQCNMFVLPNRTVGRDIEGFGMVLVEAQSCGKPVIAGDSGGTAETMIVGQTGFIVDCTKTREVSKKISSLLNNPTLCEKMGLAGREHVEQNLDWQNLSRQALAAFP